MTQNSRFDGPPFATVFADYLESSTGADLWEIIDACAAQTEGGEDQRRRRYFEEFAAIARRYPPGHPIRDCAPTYPQLRASLSAQRPDSRKDQEPHIKLEGWQR